MAANKNSYKKSSFGPAFFFLEKPRREALADYYEFCRLMDDIADEPDVKDPEQQLAFWREETARVYEGTPTTDLGRRLQKDARTFGILPDRFLLLIEGMQADLTGRTYQTAQELDWYLLRVAVIVGRATLDILGVKGPQADQLSWELGCAVQITNIIRDVSDDKALGRVYIPSDLLTKYGLTRGAVLQDKNPAKLPEVLRELAAQAEAHYKKAFALMRLFPRLKMLPCKVMGYVYLKNLAKIRKEGFALLSAPVKLTKGEKLRSVFYALLKTIF